jgi:putative membrane protein
MSPLVSFLIHCLLYALSFMLVARVVPGITIRSYGSAVLFAAVFAILDSLLFGVLTFVTLPLVILSLGLFMLVIRAGLFMLADKLVSGVEISGFVPALLGSLLTGALNGLIKWLIHF